MSLKTLLRAIVPKSVRRSIKHTFHAQFQQQIDAQSIMRMAQSCGLTLVREFVMGENPDIDNAPEPVSYAGFLFRAA